MSTLKAYTRYSKKRMHSVYFVLLPKNQAKTAREAIDEAEKLLNDNDFAGEGGFYSSHKADWFEMGGRWTGMFTEMRPWYKAFEKTANAMMKKYYPELDSGVRGVFYGGDTKENQKAKAIQDINKIWDKMKPKGFTAPCPMTRNTEIAFHSSTFDDDAVIMDEALFKKFKKEYGKEGTFHEDGAEGVIATEDGYLDSEFLVKNLKFKDIKSNWVVVVDYHM